MSSLPILYFLKTISWLHTFINVPLFGCPIASIWQLDWLLAYHWSVVHVRLGWRPTGMKFHLGNIWNVPSRSNKTVMAKCLSKRYSNNGSNNVCWTRVIFVARGGNWMICTGISRTLHFNFYFYHLFCNSQLYKILSLLIILIFQLPLT